MSQFQIESSQQAPLKLNQVLNQLKKQKVSILFIYNNPDLEAAQINYKRKISKLRPNMLEID